MSKKMVSPVPFVFKVERSLCDEIDRYCQESGDYRSRGEFGRAAFEAWLKYVKEVRKPILDKYNKELEDSIMEIDANFSAAKKGAVC